MAANQDKGGAGQDHAHHHAIPNVLGTVEQSVLQRIEDFNDPRQEWRRLFSELYGTFLLVVVAAGGGMMGQAFPGVISRTAAVVAPGLMVMGIILFMGKISGAHLNPAVSIAFALRGDFPWRRVPGYIVVQLIGATLACLLLQGVIGVSATYGSNYPAAGYTAGAAFLMEALLTMVLVSVILGTASGAQNVGLFGAFGVGVGQPHLRHVDESGTNVRAGSRQRKFQRLLGVCRRAAGRRGGRRRYRIHPARSGRREVRLGSRPGCPLHRGRRGR
jgi:aquaporin Z